jgi:uncharacterized protein HemX
VRAFCYRENKMSDKQIEVAVTAIALILIIALGIVIFGFGQEHIIQQCNKYNEIRWQDTVYSCEKVNE